MALPATAVFEIQTGGNDTNGGGFNSVSAGTDYSQVAAKRTGTGTDDSTTDAVGAGTTTITSATANFQNSIIGNIIYLQGGTGALAAGWYYVSARASATSITVDRTVAAGTGITMNIGGAMASLGGFGAVTLSASGTKIWIKAGTYLVTSATTNISGGCYRNTAAGVFIEGYQTTRGDKGTKPLIQASGISTFILIDHANNAAHRTANLKIDGASLTSSQGIAFRSQCYNIEAVNFTNSAFSGNTGTLVLCVYCTATGCTTQPAFEFCNCFGCVAYNNTVTGFDGTVSSVRFYFCIADSNSGASSDGFINSGASSDNGIFVNCVAYNNGRDGFRLNAARGGYCINCIAEDNGAWGFNGSGGNGINLLNCAGFSNTSGEVTFASGIGGESLNFVTGSSSFFTNAANQDFSLNNTAGAGADAREAGVPGAFPIIPTTGYLDIGAAQTQAGGGSGSTPTSAAYLG